jgi:hypothetical protein
MSAGEEPGRSSIVEAFSQPQMSPHSTSSRAMAVTDSSIMLAV